MEFALPSAHLPAVLHRKLATEIHGKPTISFGELVVVVPAAHAVHLSPSLYLPTRHSAAGAPRAVNLGDALGDLELVLDLVYVYFSALGTWRCSSGLGLS